MKWLEIFEKGVLYAISRCSERKKKVSPVFLRYSEANMGFLVAVRNFLAAATSFCPPYVECTHCSENESRCSGYDLSSPILASPVVAPNFPAAAIVHGLPPNISNFLFYFILFYLFLLFG